MLCCQKAATSENLFRDIEVNMTSVESAEENQIVKLQMGDGDSAISQESNLDIEMTMRNHLYGQAVMKKSFLLIKTGW